LARRPILIAGFSGRALAEGAHAAGFAPLVYDAYGDEDTRAAALRLISQGAIVEEGFRRKPMEAALAQLCEGLDHEPVGLVLGAGFERSPKLVGELAKSYRLLGSTSETIRALKDPDVFFPLLGDLGIRHAETLTGQAVGVRDRSRPWLMKRIGAMGGSHIRPLPPHDNLPAGHYAQVGEEGYTVSVTVLADGSARAFAFTQPWVDPSPGMPFRYGGIVGNLSPDVALEALLIDIVRQVTSAVRPMGLVSFDFLITPEDEALLLEVNPRPTAAYDVLEDGNGSLFAAHVLAASGRGDDAVELLSETWQPMTKAAAYVYADKGALTIADVAWPEHVHDRPGRGTEVAKGAVIATVHATGETPEAAVSNCLERSGRLSQMLYDSN